MHLLLRSEKVEESGTLRKLMSDKQRAFSEDDLSAPDVAFSEESLSHIMG